MFVFLLKSKDLSSQKSHIFLQLFFPLSGKLTIRSLSRIAEVCFFPPLELYVMTHVNYYLH